MANLSDLQYGLIISVNQLEATSWIQMEAPKATQGHQVWMGLYRTKMSFSGPASFNNSSRAEIMNSGELRIIIVFPAWSDANWREFKECIYVAEGKSREPLCRIYVAEEKSKEPLCFYHVLIKVRSLAKDLNASSSVYQGKLTGKQTSWRNLEYKGSFYVITQ